MPKSFAPEVIADNTGKFVGNGLRFATFDEAQRWAQDLASRWILVRDTRVVDSTDPVNYTFNDNKLEEVVYS